MFPVLNILAALPWRLLAAGVLASALFVGGYEVGEHRVAARWDAEKAATAQAVARQAAQVAAVTTHQTTIDQEISNEFETEKARIVADRQHLLARVSRRVRVGAASRASHVPEIPAVAGGTQAAPADAVSVTGQPDAGAACEQLGEDAALTTLMVVQFQKWYREQAVVFASRDQKIRVPYINAADRPDTEQEQRLVQHPLNRLNK